MVEPILDGIVAEDASDFGDVESAIMKCNPIRLIETARNSDYVGVAAMLAIDQRVDLPWPVDPTKTVPFSPKVMERAAETPSA